MPVSFRLPKSLIVRGWKVKIRDRERLEPPHVSVMYKTAVWRFDLRRAAFMDREPDEALIPEDMRLALDALIPQLCAAWDAMYPANPVRGNDV